MTTRVIDRQYPLAAVVDCGIANIGAGNGYDIGIPVNAMLLDVVVLTTTAFDGTTNTATVGDGTTTFANAVDIKTTGAETVANAPKFYPTGGTISVTLAQTGTATVGRVLVMVRYIVLNRGGERAE